MNFQMFRLCQNHHYIHLFYSSPRNKTLVSSHGIKPTLLSFHSKMSTSPPFSISWKISWEFSWLNRKFLLFFLPNFIFYIIFSYFEVIWQFSFFLFKAKINYNAWKEEAFRKGQRILGFSKGNHYVARPIHKVNVHQKAWKREIVITFREPQTT